MHSPSLRCSSQQRSAGVPSASSSCLGARQLSVVCAVAPAQASRQQAIVQHVDPDTAQRLSRRAAFVSAASLLILPVSQAQASNQSSLCVDAKTEAEDTICRRNLLAQDAANKEDYGSVSARKFSTAPQGPVAELNSEYAVATLKLSEQIEQYCSVDVYDKGRIPLIKSLKTDSTTWVSKYARGGSARSQSARRMYIAVDSVVGHLASNGYAPLPAPKVKAVLKSIGEARDFLAKGL